MICPIHKLPLVARATQFGMRHGCTADGCTVASWAGATSTPADDETRQLRRQAHALFDPLWQEGRWPSRSAAYRWLALFMGLTKDDAHIGRFDAGQCRKLLDALEAARGGIPAGASLHPDPARG